MNGHDGTLLPLTAILDGHINVFKKAWTESVCKMIACDLNKNHAVFELYGNRISYNRAWREIEQWYRRR